MNNFGLWKEILDSKYEYWINLNANTDRGILKAYVNKITGKLV